MSDMHGAHNGLPDRVHQFVVACATNELTDDLRTEFEQLLRESDEACRLYLKCVDVSVLLPSILSAIPDEESPSDISFLEQSQAMFHPAPVAMGSVGQGMVGDFSSGWPVAYLVATVICGLGLLIGASMHVSTPVQVVRQSVLSPTPVAPDRASKMEFVGRITGMVDCQWSDPATEAIIPTAA
jgi:hypothetical protein